MDERALSERSAASSATEQAVAVSTTRGWLIVAVLILGSILSMLDRQILSLMVGPIKADLGLSDLQVGLLQGFAFALFYSLAAVPIGWLVDRAPRGIIAGSGVILWSIMTGVCGLASTYLQLFMARMGVGVGEASLGPASHALIADLFPPARMALALSVFGIGSTLGAALAYIIGGQVITAVTANGPFSLPGWGPLATWQVVFLVVGFPGVLVGILVLAVVVEPRRTRHSHPGGSSTRFRAFAGEHAGLLALLMGGIGMLTATSYASLSWLPAFFDRRFDWAPDRAGALLGSLVLFASAPGGLLCGWLASRWTARGQSIAPLLTMAAAHAACVPFLAGAFLLPIDRAVVGALIIPMLLGSAFVGLGPAVIQGMTPSALRGRLAATQLLLTNLIGMTLGPLGVAFLTDHVFQDEQAVGSSLAVATSAFTLAGVVMLFAATRGYRAVLERAARPESAVADPTARRC